MNTTQMREALQNLDKARSFLDDTLKAKKAALCNKDGELQNWHQIGISVSIGGYSFQATTMDSRNCNQKTADGCAMIILGIQKLLNEQEDKARRSVREWEDYIRGLTK